MTPEKAYQKALRRIRKAEETGAVELVLSRLETLNQLPRELTRLTSLQSLNLAFCKRLSGDLSPLASLTSLQLLDLAFCGQLSGDLSPLAGLTSLQTLNLSWCTQLSADLSPLTGLTSLQSLNLSWCLQLSGDLSPLASLTSLQSLDLHECHNLSGDLSPLASLTSLQSLNLAFCKQLSGDLSPLASLTSLRSLDLSWCEKLSGDISPLAGLTSLQSLELVACKQISDPSALAGLTSLRTLKLDYCGVRRFTPLEFLLPTLKELSVFACRLEDLPDEVRGEKYSQNVLNKVRAYYRHRRPDASPKIAKTPTQPFGTPPQVFVSYAWGDISPNASEEGSQRQEVVERLCRTLQQENWKVIRDKDEFEYGDQISTFMKTLGQARLVIVVLSDKYLRSPYCMTELHSVYQNARQERQEFLNRIIPLVLKDANIGNWRGRATYAEHWESEFKAMEQHFTHLGEEDLKLYKAMRRWHNDVGDMLAYVNDKLSPHGFDEIVKNDFSALRTMLLQSFAPPAAGLKTAGLSAPSRPRWHLPTILLSIVFCLLCLFWFAFLMGGGTPDNFHSSHTPSAPLAPTIRGKWVIFGDRPEDILPNEKLTLVKPKDLQNPDIKKYFLRGLEDGLMRHLDPHQYYLSCHFSPNIWEYLHSNLVSVTNPLDPTRPPVKAKVVDWGPPSEYKGVVAALSRGLANALGLNEGDDVEISFNPN